MLPAIFAKPSKSGRYFIALLAILHLVGVLGLSITRTRDIFLLLCPIQLLITVIGLIILHDKENGRIWLFLIPAGIMGWAIEVAGVATGLIFGHYRYGPPLGPALLGVPVMIGVNWAVLVYCVSSLAAPLPYPAWVRCLAAGLLLTLFDFLMEPAATQLGFWTWQDAHIPMQNYLAWFATGTLLSGLYFLILNKKQQIKTSPVAGAILVVQAVFFALVMALS